MPSFIEIKDLQEIKLPSVWTEPKQFNSYNKVVQGTGKLQGHHFKLVAKKERNLRVLERLWNIVLGLLKGLVAVLTFGQCASFKATAKLLCATKKKVRFGIRTNEPLSSTPSKGSLLQLPKHLRHRNIYHYRHDGVMGYSASKDTLNPDRPAGPCGYHAFYSCLKARDENLHGHSNGRKIAHNIVRTGLDLGITNGPQAAELRNLLKIAQAIGLYWNPSETKPINTIFLGLPQDAPALIKPNSPNFPTPILPTQDGELQLKGAHKEMKKLFEEVGNELYNSKKEKSTIHVFCIYKDTNGDGHVVGVGVSRSDDRTHIEFSQYLDRKMEKSPILASYIDFIEQYFCSRTIRLG